MSRVIWWLAAAFALGSATVRAVDSATEVRSLFEAYERGFRHPATGLFYHHRLDGPQGEAALSTPAEIAKGEVRGKPVPYGYGSGIQDVALENGQLLFALCEAWDVTGDEFLAGKARSLFAALQALARLSPEPGFVPRGPHPDGRSYYRDSSRDQHAAYIEALWRYGRSSLATAADRTFVAATLAAIAARMERNDWRILVEDGSGPAHVGWTWKQFTSIGAISLLSALAQVSEATSDLQWRLRYDQASAERAGERWNKWLSPQALDQGQPLTLYANQFCQSLTALRRVEADAVRSRQIAEFQRCWARRALDANVFDPACWRRLDWASERSEPDAAALVAQLGLDVKRPMTVCEVYRSFDRRFWQRPGTEGFRVMGKLAYGLCTVALHGALLAGNPALRVESRPIVRQMVEEFAQFGQAYDAGENFNRVVILGLLSLENGAGVDKEAPSPR